jgi:hypothetical protein
MDEMYRHHLGFDITVLLFPSTRDRLCFRITLRVTRFLDWGDILFARNSVKIGRIGVVSKKKTLT